MVYSHISCLRFSCFHLKEKLRMCRIMYTSYPLSSFINRNQSSSCCTRPGQTLHVDANLWILHTLFSNGIVYTIVACFPCQKPFDIFYHRHVLFCCSCEQSGAAVALSSSSPPSSAAIWSYHLSEDVRWTRWGFVLAWMGRWMIDIAWNLSVWRGERWILRTSYRSTHQHSLQLQWNRILPLHRCSPHCRPFWA